MVAHNVVAKHQPGDNCDVGSGFNVGLYEAHSTDCTKFLQCANGIFVEQPCHVGLHWNNVIKSCDWPNIAGCEQNNQLRPDIDVRLNPQPIIPKRNDTINDHWLRNKTLSG